MDRKRVLFEDPDFPMQDSDDDVSMFPTLPSFFFDQILHVFFSFFSCWMKFHRFSLNFRWTLMKCLKFLLRILCHYPYTITLDQDLRYVLFKTLTETPLFSFLPMFTMFFPVFQNRPGPSSRGLPFIADDAHPPVHVSINF